MLESEPIAIATMHKDEVGELKGGGVCEANMRKEGRARLSPVRPTANSYWLCVLSKPAHPS